MANEYRGEVEVDLGGNTYTMRPTLNAIAMLEGKGGSVRKLLSKFLAQDQHGNSFVNDEWRVTDVVQIIQAGFAGQGGNAPKASDVAQLVMDEGAQNLTVACIQFLSNCLTGGKAVAAAVEEDEAPTEGSGE